MKAVLVFDCCICEEENKLIPRSRDFTSEMYECTKCGYTITRITLCVKCKNCGKEHVTLFDVSNQKGGSN